MLFSQNNIFLIMNSTLWYHITEIMTRRHKKTKIQYRFHLNYLVLELLELDTQYLNYLSVYTH